MFLDQGCGNRDIDDDDDDECWLVFKNSNF